jgi:hypothetical protein
MYEPIVYVVFSVALPMLYLEPPLFFSFYENTTSFNP